MSTHRVNNDVICLAVPPEVDLRGDITPQLDDMAKASGLSIRTTI